MNLSDEDKGYAAGLFDADGNVIIVNQSGRPQLRVHIDGGSVRAMNWLVAHFGGGFWRKQRPQKAGEISNVTGKKIANDHKQTWTWRIVGASAVEFLTTIQRLSIEKNMQIQVAIDPTLRWGWESPLASALRGRREEAKARLQELKRIGDNQANA